MLDGIIKSAVLFGLAGGGYFALRTYQHRHVDPAVVAKAQKAEQDHADADSVRRLVERVLAGPRTVDVLVVDRTDGETPRTTLLFQEQTSIGSLLPAHLAFVEGRKASFTVVFVPLSDASLPADAQSIAASVRVPLLTSVTGDAAGAESASPEAAPATKPAAVARPIDQPGVPPFVYRGPEIAVSPFQQQLWKELWQSAHDDTSLTRSQSKWLPLEAGKLYTLTFSPFEPIRVKSTRHLSPDEMERLQRSIPNSLQ